MVPAGLREGTGGRRPPVRLCTTKAGVVLEKRKKKAFQRERP